MLCQAVSGSLLLRGDLNQAQSVVAFGGAALCSAL